MTCSSLGVHSIGSATPVLFSALDGTNKLLSPLTCSHFTASKLPLRRLVS
ncbi:MAG: hypothetical protein JHC40_21065 [Burkholderiales bacterium]|jgi:hypothetical protein|nr:hypothetical protein [Burkholderiales bacterium]